MPIFLISNVMGFVYANFLTTGVSVKLYLKAGPLIIDGKELKNFNLINSVRDMWDAGVYPLAILIAGFSGIWY